MKCSVCSGKNTSIYKKDVRSVYSDRAFNIVHCRDCKHFFTSADFTSEELDNIYSNKYSYDAHALIEKEKQMRARHYAKYISKIPDVNSVLEVGCMHGLLLQELKRHGLKVAGVELDPEAVSYCQEQGLDVTQDSIENHLKKAGTSSDVVVMSHVIEHITNPIAQLSTLHKRMPKKGKLVLITPNSKALSRKLMGRYWGYWQVPVHVNHFNLDSMKKLLSKTGFKLSHSRNFGADSLFFLSSAANMTRTYDQPRQLTRPKKALVQAATFGLRPWYYLGNEDMFIVAEKS